MAAMRRFFLLLASLLILGAGLYGQQAGTGTITGVVTDSSGALIPDAKVTATAVQTGVARSTTTGPDGTYTIPYLLTGSYELTVEKTSFSKYVQSGITLLVDSTLTLNFKLSVGSTVEKVEVTAAAPLLQSSTSDIGATIDNRSYEALPLAVNGARMDPAAFMLLAPGVTGSTFEAQVNGGESFTNEIWLGGVPSGLGELQSSDRPAQFGSSVDAFQEFKLTTNNYSADLGRAGGVLDLEYKSGTNHFHGDIFGFLRNEALNARGFFPKTTPRNRQTEYGFSVGGPVNIPKIYNGHDRTFFFFNYDGFRQWPAASGGLFTLPTPAELAGNFQGIAHIYDPTTAVTLPNGQVMKQEYSCNNQLDVICPAKFSAISKNFLPLLPAATNPNLLVNNYVGVLPGKPESIEDSYTMRIDHAFSTKQNLTFSWGFGPQKSPLASGNVNGILGPLGGYRSYGGYEQVIRLSDTYSFHPNLLNRFSFGYGRDGTLFKDPQAGIPWPTRLGFTNIPNNTMPDVEFATNGFAPWHPDGFTGGALNDTYQFLWEDQLTWIHGKQTLKFGVDARRGGYILNIHSDPGPFTFSSTDTSQQGVANTGNAFASFLVGAADSAGLRINAAGTVDDFWTYMAGYFQDDYKIRPKLTLNLGLRYDLPYGTEERYNKLSNFDPTVPNPGAGNIPGAQIFAGHGPGTCNCNRFTNLAVTEFGPRFGLAYQLTSNTVFRGGYGIFYTPGGDTGGNDIGSQPLGWAGSPSVVSPNGGFTPAWFWDTPFQYPAGFKVPNFSPTIQNGGGNNWEIKGYGNQPYVQNWNVNIQRQITPDLMVSAAYVGSKGTRLAAGLFRANQVPSNYLSLGNLLGQNINSAAALAAIAAGTIPGPRYAGFTGTVAQNLRPFPQYQGITVLNDLEGNSTYHSFQLMVQKRFSRGLQVLVSYTGAKTIDDVGGGGVIAGGWASGRDTDNRRIEKAVSAFDIPQHIVLSYVYELPFGPNKKFINHSGPVGKLVEGWQISGIQTYESGIPIGMSVTNTLNIFNGGNYPNIVPGVSPRSNVSLTDFQVFGPNPSNYINLNAFSNPAPFTFGNAPRELSNLRTPASYNEDISLTKHTHIKERVDVELRADAFNLLNRVVFAMGQGSVGAFQNFSSPATVGKVSSQSNSGRQIQLGLKIRF